MNADNMDMGMPHAPHGAGGCGLKEQASPVVRLDGLYDRHGRIVFSFFKKKVRSIEDAEDLMQDVFVQALTQLNRGNSPHGDEAKPWLMGIARNVLADFYRRGVGAEPPSVSWEALRESEYPDDVMEAEMREHHGGLDIVHDLQLSNDIWAALRPSERRAFQLREVMNVPANELVMHGCHWSPAYYYRMASQARAHMEELRRSMTAK